MKNTLTHLSYIHPYTYICLCIYTQETHIERERVKGVYRPLLFKDVGSIFVSPGATVPNQEKMQELIKVAGGKVYNYKLSILKGSTLTDNIIIFLHIEILFIDLVKYVYTYVCAVSDVCLFPYV